MKWMRFRVRTTAEAEDILISEMEEIGLDGAQIEDNVPLTAAEKEQMFVDILPEGPADDGKAFLSFFLEEKEDGTLAVGEETKTADQVRGEMKEVLERVRSWGVDIGDGTISVDETEDLDWINNWKQYFHQFWIDDILVIPSWESPEAEARKPRLTLHIDPGTAFGTGMHETTQLCIRQIREYLTPETRILDLGTGSGILAILALMLGAESAVGTDLDPCAPPAILDNMKNNGVDPDKFEVILGNLIDDKEVQDKVGYGKYDIVVANILADILSPMTPAAARCLKSGGVYITSGIIEGREKDVAAAMEKAGLTVTGITAQGEWRCVTACRPRA